jgi:hypothetical protein
MNSLAAAIAGELYGRRPVLSSNGVEIDVSSLHTHLFPFDSRAGAQSVEAPESVSVILT